VVDSGEKGRVKVIDRRRFTSEGELREGDQGGDAGTHEPAPAGTDQDAGAGPVGTTPEPALAAAPVRTSDTAPSAPSGAEPSPLPAAPGVADIVDLLAQQAMAFLSGQVPGRGRDPVTARYFIDLLGVLKEKTTGRLTLEETNFLDDVLYQVRSLYVAATR
jgi:hypothetical protein